MAQHQRPTSKDDPIRAAQYVRMSTEHQQYSIDNQAATISRYALEHSMEIIQTYSDAGKSGLTIENRPGLKKMIHDVESGAPGYSAILVYDVSRWGRFQDADESAYYEYRCRRANIAVIYCAELFPNDGSLSASLLKTIKRAMAAEYSRELSAKVFAGQVRLIELGFRQGGTAGYGLRRLLVDEDGKPKFVLARGERKSIATDRVVLIPGPAEEVEAVNEVFRLYAEERCPTKEIARILNERGIRCEEGRPWTRCIVRRMVTNPKYIGANVYNKYSTKLHGPRVTNSPDRWIQRDHAFQGIVDSGLYQKAQTEAETRSRILTDEQLLELLRQLLRKHGKISEKLIKTSLEMPCPQCYNARFGGLAEAYRRIGYNPSRNLAYVERDRALKSIRQAFVVRVVGELVGLGSSVRLDNRTKLVVVNRNLKLRLIVSRCRTWKRIQSWKLHLYSPLKPNFTIFARLMPENQTILDYFCLPWSGQAPSQMTVKRVNNCSVDAHCFSDLAFLQDLEAIKNLRRPWYKRASYSGG